MEFKTLDDMIAYIEQHTDKTVEQKGKVKDKENLYWIHTEEGQKILNGSAYYSRSQILEAIKSVFELNIDAEIPKLFTLLNNKIRNM